MSEKRNMAYRILRWRKWELVQEVTLPEKCIICIAPHTSNWDFAVGVLFKSALRIKASFFMKKEWFRFPFGKMMRRLGGIPVERSKSTSMTDRIASEFNNREQLIVAVTPEGTRSYNTDWKKGFYYIALKANVPIVLAFIDFKFKRVGYERLFIPTGDVETDMVELKNYYKTFNAKYPDKFGV